MLLLTRPLKQAQNDAHYFNSKGVNCVMCPMLDIECADFTMPDIDSFDVVICTSTNALECYRGDFNKAIITVGDQTALKARELGFDNVHSIAGTAKDIVTLIQTPEHSKARYLYLRGRDIRLDIAGELRGYGVQCDEIIAYKAVCAEEIPQKALDYLKNGNIKAIAFLSNRTAENFARLVRVYNLQDTLKGTKALCISGSVLECVRVFGWASTHVSKRPDGDAMKDLIITEYQV